jgi:hypothetical protein
MLVLVLTLAVIVPASASWATLDSGEFNSAVNALQLVDPTIDPPPAGENWALVVGGGRTECPSFAISARSGPEGEDLQGVLALVQSACGGENFTARVTCLAVEGIFAGVGGVIVQSNFTPIIGMPFVAAFGDPGNAQRNRRHLRPSGWRAR